MGNGWPFRSTLQSNWCKNVTPDVGANTILPPPYAHWCNFATSGEVTGNVVITPSLGGATA